MNEDLITSLSVRIDQLERHNRRLKRWAAGFVLTMVAILLVGASPANQEDEVKLINSLMDRVDRIERLADSDVAEFKTVHAQRIAIRDSTDKDRLILELDQKEPTLTMFNHNGLQQVYLGINESWGDAAYLSVSSRLRGGATGKQSLLIARDNDSQLLLCDLDPRQENAARRHLVRVATGDDTQKPYVEFRESSAGRKTEVTLDMLNLNPSQTGRRLFLDTTPGETTISGAVLSQR